MSNRDVIWSFWFEDSAVAFVTIDAQQYRQVLSRCWTALKRKLSGTTQQLDQQWFQQHGATAQSAGATRQWLRDRFGSRLISRREERDWPSHSPNLLLLDLFLWGQLKSRSTEPTREP